MAQRPFQSLTQAVETYYEELRQFVLRRTGSRTLAEDVIQETWLRASTPGGVMPDNPRAYLYRMAGNIAIDHLRRIRTQTRVEGGSLADPRAPTQDGQIEIASPSPFPDEVAAAREELAILCGAIEELPEKCRQVFLLYRGDGLTMREIAVRLNVSQKTVENHIARAMVHCRRRLSAAGRKV